MTDSNPDIGKEIEDKLKDLAGLATAGAVSIGIAELAKSLLQPSNTSESTHFASSSTSSFRGRCTIAEVWISSVEATVGRSVFFLLQKYEELIRIPPGTKDGTKLYFTGRGLPGQPNSDERSDLLVIVHIS